MYCLQTTAFALICSTLVCTGSMHSTVIGDNVAMENGIEHVALAAVISVATVICIVKLIGMCAEFCKKQQSFKEFTDDVVVVETQTNAAPVASDFTMYPPVESTPDAIAHVPPVTFDPLPDISQLRPKSQVANVTQLRPKISNAPQSDDEHDDYDLDDVARRRDPSQDKMKLHNLLSNSRHQIPREQIQYIKELGSGWFGKVLQGEGQRILPGHKKTKIVIQMLKEDAPPYDQLAFLQEGLPYREIDHQNVMKLYGQCIDVAPYLNILELCTFGDLKTYLRSHRVAVESFNEKGLLLKFAADIAAGLQAMHERNYVHRDFAARNCLLSSELTVKVGDYGVAEDVFKEDYLFDKNGDGLPIRWLAPECVLVQEHQEVSLRNITKQCNIWSFGVVIWEVMTFGNLPYADLSNDHVLRLVIREKSLKLPTPDMPLSHLDRLQQLMNLCWSAPAARPNLRELRIMLLHLLSNKINAHSTEFEKKWNQLMPRRHPGVVQARNQQVNGSVRVMIEERNEVHGAVPYSNHGQNRPGSFESDFVEPPNAHKQINRSANPFLAQGEMAQVHSHKLPSPEAMSTPVNELSLAAELSSFDMGPSDTTPVNNKSLADEFGAMDSVESHGVDEIIILDSSGDKVETAENNTAHVDVAVASPSSHAQSSVPSNDITSPITSTADTSTSNYMSPLQGPEFATSTPKKSEAPENTLNTNEHSEDQLSSLYKTALTTQTSVDSNTSFTSRESDEEQSIFGQKKFAAMLQTVVTSFDDEDGSWSFDNTGTSFEAIPEEDEESLAMATNDVFNTDAVETAQDINTNKVDITYPAESKTNDDETGTAVSNTKSDSGVSANGNDEANTESIVVIDEFDFLESKRVVENEIHETEETVTEAVNANTDKSGDNNGNLKDVIEDIIFGEEDKPENSEQAQTQNEASDAHSHITTEVNAMTTTGKEGIPTSNPISNDFSLLDDPETEEVKKFKDTLILDFTADEEKASGDADIFDLGLPIEEQDQKNSLKPSDNAVLLDFGLPNDEKSIGNAALLDLEPPTDGKAQTDSSFISLDDSVSELSSISVKTNDATLVANESAHVENGNV